MTAQQPDRAIVDGVDYAVASVAGTGLFEPFDAGLAPRPIHTGCWRGYVCWYAVRDARLVLDRLVLGPGTELRGRVLEPGDELLGRTVGPSGDGAYAACLEIVDAGLPVRFTGTLLLGRDFVQATYVHMGFHPAWKFATVLEVTADDGAVREIADRSAEFAEIRAGILAGAAPDPDGPPGAPGWIERTFGRGPRRSGR